MFFKRRKLLNCYLAVIGIWAVVLLIIHLTLFDVLSFSYLIGAPLTLDNDQLRQLMLPVSSSVITRPLFLIISPSENFYQFYHLPKRKWNAKYGEVDCYYF